MPSHFFKRLSSLEQQQLDKLRKQKIPSRDSKTSHKIDQWSYINYCHLLLRQAIYGKYQRKSFDQQQQQQSIIMSDDLVWANIQLISKQNWKMLLANLKQYKQGFIQSKMILTQPFFQQARQHDVQTNPLIQNQLQQYKQYHNQIKSLIKTTSYQIQQFLIQYFSFEYDSQISLLVNQKVQKTRIQKQKLLNPLFQVLNKIQIGLYKCWNDHLKHDVNLWNQSKYQLNIMEITIIDRIHHKLKQIGFTFQTQQHNTANQNDKNNQNNTTIQNNTINQKNNRNNKLDQNSPRDQNNIDQNIENTLDTIDLNMNNLNNTLNDSRFNHSILNLNNTQQIRQQLSKKVQTSKNYPLNDKKQNKQTNTKQTNTKQTSTKQKKINNTKQKKLFNKKYKKLDNEKQSKSLLLTQFIRIKPYLQNIHKNTQNLSTKAQKKMTQMQDNKLPIVQMNSLDKLLEQRNNIKIKQFIDKKQKQNNIILGKVLKNQKTYNFLNHNYTSTNIQTHK